MPNLQDTMNSVARGVAKGMLGKDFVYCIEEDCFFVFIDNVWSKIYEVELLSEISEHKDFEYINASPIGQRKSILDNLKLLTHKRLSDFNKFDFINFKSGMFDVLGNNLIAHDKKYLSTIRIPYKYDPLAECPLWLSTLEGIFESDKDRIDILQEFIGYCLTRDVTREKSLLLLGESRSGKSTILNTINYLIGEDNVSSVALCNLGKDQYTPMLINKMVNIDWDTSANAQDFEQNFKVIASGEPVNVNQKFVKTFTFRPYCKLILAANKFPRITDHSSAFYKRLILIPCKRVFEPEEQDSHLKEKLIHELSGIFNWALNGLYRLTKRNRFEINKEFMLDALQDLRDESNPIDVFFRETITVDTFGNLEINKLEFYDKYSKWCKINGNFPLANNKFGNAVFAKYSSYTPKDTKSKFGDHKRVWKNLKYIEDEVTENKQIKWQE